LYRSWNLCFPVQNAADRGLAPLVVDPVKRLSNFTDVVKRVDRSVDSGGPSSRPF
jgi:hypothetical protein